MPYEAAFLNQRLLGLGAPTGNEDEEAYRRRMLEETRARYGVVRGGVSDPEAAVGGYLGRYQRALANLEGAGAQATKDIRQRYAERGTEITQDLVSRGLAGSTAGLAPRAALAREEEASLGDLNERLRQQKLTTDASLSEDILRFMAARGLEGGVAGEGGAGGGKYAGSFGMQVSGGGGGKGGLSGEMKKRIRGDRLKVGGHAWAQAMRQQAAAQALQQRLMQQEQRFVPRRYASGSAGTLPGSALYRRRAMEEQYA